MSTLRLLERERDIPVDVLIPTIEQALVLAYLKSPGAISNARAEIERRTGHVTVAGRVAGSEQAGRHGSGGQHRGPRQGDGGVAPASPASAGRRARVDQPA